MTYSDALQKLKNVVAASRTQSAGRVVRTAKALVQMSGGDGRLAIVHVAPPQDVRPEDFALFVLLVADRANAEVEEAIVYNDFDESDVIAERINRWLDHGVVD